jgi:hypothetical protein
VGIYSGCADDSGPGCCHDSSEDKQLWRT